MNEEALVQRRVTAWRRLAELSNKAEGGFRTLSGEETVEFVRLYRKASADLAFMTTQTSNTEIIAYLNSIVTRAYGQLYRSPSKKLAKVLGDGILSAAFVFRRQIWAFLLCSLIFFTGTAFAYVVLTQRPDLRRHFVPDGMEENFEVWKSGRHNRRNADESVGASAFYASNNPRAGIVANAVSIATFGTLTTYLLWMNGTLLGALAAEVSKVGQLGFLLSSVAPHGVSEIGGLLVTAGGGFVMARALINPGRKTRGQALREAGKESFVLLMLGLVMIAIAAPIEGFFSFNPSVPQWAKIVFAALAFVAWTTYLLGYGRKTQEEAPGTH